MSGGRPDFTVSVKHKDAKYATKIGAAWRTKDGSGVNIRLDPGVSVSTPEGVFLTLWPYETKEEREARFAGAGNGGRRETRQQPSSQGGDWNADDIGF